MKYEAEVDLRNSNTSHALLAEFTGCRRRVLDVGCANGSLGGVLTRRGCRVAGVESDPEAAEAAAKVLDTVLVGDIGTLDLVGHFGKESFDVVVFGDVLEHLVDPAAALKKVRPLLSDGGFVVASVPNVAHGSVRLSLLNGRFDYRPLGLLDSTHLRFFTRESLHELFVEAGLVPVDVRRTTAGIFETEVKVRREDFDPSVVDAVEGDPESTTYQFVLKAVPEGDPEETASPSAPARPPGALGTPRIGIFADWEPDDLCQSLLVRVTTAELARRLERSAIRPFSSSTSFRPSPHDGGLPVEPLGAWSDDRARQLRAELDCVIVVGDIPTRAHGEQEDSSRFLVDGLGPESEPDCPLVWSGVRLRNGPMQRVEGILANPPYRAVVEDANGEGSGPPEAPTGSTVTVPDPLLLVPRLLHSDALSRRLEFVRMMGWFPRQGPAVVVEMDRSLLPHAQEVARGLDALVSDGERSVVLVETQPGDAECRDAAEAVLAAMTVSAYRVPSDALVDDLVAVIANAGVLVACSAPALTLGLAYERPLAHVQLADDASLSPLARFAGNEVAAIRPRDLADLSNRDLFRPTPAAVAPLQSRLDAHFDHIAAIADGAASLRPRVLEHPAALAPPEHVAAMQLAHRRMRERMDAERRAVADHLFELHSGHQSELAGLQTEIAVLRRENEPVEARLREALEEIDRQGQHLAEQRNRLEAVAAELEALKGIRILRLLRPARAVYARLRGGRL